PRVLREIDNTRLFIDGNRLVLKSPHRRQRHRRYWSVCRGRYFETIPMWLFKSADLGSGGGRTYLFADRRLLTADPAPPWRRSPGAVNQRPREAHNFSLRRPGLVVDDDGGRPSARRRVVMVRCADG